MNPNDPFAFYTRKTKISGLFVPAISEMKPQFRASSPEIVNCIFLFFFLSHFLFSFLFLQVYDFLQEKLQLAVSEFELEHSPFWFSSNKLYFLFFQSDTFFFYSNTSFLLEIWSCSFKNLTAVVQVFLRKSLVTTSLNSDSRRSARFSLSPLRMLLFSEWIQFILFDHIGQSAVVFPPTALSDL